MIVGAGPAGLAAGIYGVRSGLETLVLDEKMAGGTVADAPVVDNYPGIQGERGSDIAKRIHTHAKNMGVKINEFERVEGVSLSMERKLVKTQKTDYEAKAIIIAAGSHYRELGVPGEKEFRGRGVSYCGICDGPFFKGKRVLVVGGGNSAVITALYLANLAGETKVVHRRETFRAEEMLAKELMKSRNVEVLWNTEVKEITGDKVVKKVIVLDKKSKETRDVIVDGVFVQVGESPNSQLAREGGVAVDEYGFVKVDWLQHTNVAGVYAAGDVTNHPVKQVGTAVGQGITAALEAYGYIRRPYYKQ